MGAKHCAVLDDQQLDALPTLQLGFTAHGGKGGLVIRPRHYMVEYPRLHKSRLRRSVVKQSNNANASRSYCVGIFDNQRAGTVIGASLIRQREVIFDLARGAISFVESDCANISPATSALEGGNPHPWF